MKARDDANTPLDANVVNALRSYIKQIDQSANSSQSNIIDNTINDKHETADTPDEVDAINHIDEVTTSSITINENEAINHTTDNEATVTSTSDETINEDIYEIDVVIKKTLKT